jgi:tetratricopeptide (TPR) repeat protein
MSGIRPAPASWQRLEALFNQAIALDRDRQHAFIDQACGDDADLRQRLERLLAAHRAVSASDDVDAASHDGGDSFLHSVDSERAGALLAESEMEPATGMAIGRYRVVRQLGRGGMGVVYLAHDPALDRHVALKLLPAWLGGDPAANDRLLAEARAASTLDHPHIATIYEVDRTDDDRLFIAMAWCPGETLRQRLDRGAMDAADVVRIGEQLADGIAAAHDAGVIHRDIKPENVIIGPDGRARILDFGIARATATMDSSDAPAGGLRGTVAYMSPEQTRGDTADQRTDIWSLGVTLYEALAGRRPFAGDSIDAVVISIRNDSPPELTALRPDIPPRLAAAIHRCLHKDADRRFTSAAALRDALRQSPRRNRRPLAASLAVALLLAGGAGMVAVTGGPRITESRGLTADALAEPGRIVIADVDTMGASPDVAGVAAAVREALGVDLQQSEFVSVVSRSQVAAILRRMDAQPSATLVVDLAREVAQRAGADAVLSLGVSQVGGRYLLTGRAIDPADGAELFAVRTDVTERRLLAGVEVLSRDMRRRLGEAQDGIRRSRPLPEVSTPSLYALQRYAEAERLVAQSEPDAALAVLEDALRDDPEFAMAHRLAGAITSSLLRFGDARQHMSRAFEMRARLTDRERWHVEAFYHATVTLEPHQAARSYTMLLERYPDDSRAANNLGVMQNDWLADTDAALRSFMRASDLDPQSALSLNNAINAAFLSGRTRLADSLAALATARAFAGIEERWQLGRDFALADHASWMPACHALLAGRPTSDDLEFCGSADIAAGQLDRGTARLEQAGEMHMSAGRARNAVHAWQGMAMAHALRGDTAAAARTIEAVLARVPADVLPEPDRFITRTNLQVQAALMNRADLVRLIAEAYPPFTPSEHWFGRTGDGLVDAALAVANGRGIDAMQALDANWPRDREAIGWRIWHELIRGMAFELTGHPDSAISRYRRAADPSYLPIPALTKNRLYLPVVMRRRSRCRSRDRRRSRCCPRPGGRTPAPVRSAARVARCSGRSS